MRIRSSIFTLYSSVTEYKNIPLLSAVTEKQVSVPEAHKIIWSPAPCNALPSPLTNAAVLAFGPNSTTLNS